MQDSPRSKLLRQRSLSLEDQGLVLAANGSDAELGSGISSSPRPSPRRSLARSCSCRSNSSSSSSAFASSSSEENSSEDDGSDSAGSKAVLELDYGSSAMADASLTPAPLPVTPSNRKEQELLVNLQELQREVTVTHIQIETPQEEIVPPLSNARRRLIMVSNRLPISFSKNEATGEWEFHMSSGGLVTALNGIRDQVPFIWIGWLGEEIAHEDQSKVREKLAKEFNCVPVFLSKEVAARYYNDFSNDLLWPIFHYVALPLLRAGSEKKFDFRLWDAYKLANKRFAQAVNQVYRDGDLIWVHDYHLMMLPSLLRKRHPSCKIGWFLHTPFPSSEMYRMLPVGTSILEGLLAADLLGFHTYDYARHFLSSCARLRGATTSPKGIEWEDHFAAVGVFPIGIDPDHFANVLAQPETQKRIAELSVTFAGRQVIIGVDRMDYIKGIPHKLLAMERFLAHYPDARERVVFIQIGVPSRTGVLEYQNLAASVNEMVGRINGRYGTLQHTPVHYIHRSVPPTELVALYNISDVCLVTSVRDGMNLVSHEYVMCQTLPCELRQNGPGVLILSEFAGSAQSLSGAMRVNPWNTREIATAMEYALMMPRAEREYRQSNLYNYVKTHTASYWGKSFLTDLEDAGAARALTVRRLIKLPVMDVLNIYSRSKKRLIVLDYEGTLQADNSQRTSLAPPRPSLKRIVEQLAADSKNTVVLISRHERSVLTSWLNDRRVGVVAESGFHYRLPNSDTWETMVEDVDASWKRVVQPTMRYFTERTPGSFVENKESSLTWHYGETDPIFGPMQARDLQVNLEDVLCALPLEVLQGSSYVEVRVHGIAKTVILDEVVKQAANTKDEHDNDAVKPDRDQLRAFDFVFCAGDGLEDDEVFTFFKEYDMKMKKQAKETHSASESFMPTTSRSKASRPDAKPTVFTCHIGTGKTEALYYLERPQDLVRMLRSLAAQSREGISLHDEGLVPTLPLPSP